MKVHYFDDAVADQDDWQLAMAKERGYVPRRCLLGGRAVMFEINKGQYPCWGCNGPRSKCGGVPKRSDWQFSTEPAPARSDPATEPIQVAQYWGFERGSPAEASTPEPEPFRSGGGGDFGGGGASASWESSDSSPSTDSSSYSSDSSSSDSGSSSSGTES